MKLVLDYDKCIGCGLCFMLKSDFFSLDDDGYCMLKKTEASSEEEIKIKEVICVCPTNAIKIEDDKKKDINYIN